MAQAQPYDVIRGLEGGVELRHYPAHTLISIDVRGDFDSAGNLGFGPLVQYISGLNSARQKIAMTSPVVQAPHDSQEHTVSFVLPEGSTPEGAPIPTDARVRVAQQPARDVAALRFSGSWKQARVMEKTQHLLDVLHRQGVTTSGDVFYGRFDPPGVPPFLRHNEALVPVGKLRG
jgi:hypothetical protein